MTLNSRSRHYHAFQYTTKKNLEGALGFEPGTSRSAVECSTTELYPRSIHLLLSIFGNEYI